MANAPKYTPGQVRPGSLPGVRFSPSATPSSFGAKQGKSMEIAGRGLQRGADELGDYALKQQERHNRTVTRDMLNRARQDMSEKMNKILSTEGLDAMNAAETTKKAMEEIKRGYASDIKNPHQRELFNTVYSRYSSQNIQKAMSHQQKQSEIHEKITRDAENNQSIREAVMFHNDDIHLKDRFGKIMANVKEDWKAHGKEVVRAKQNEAAAVFHNKVIEAKMADAKTKPANDSAWNEIIEYVGKNSKHIDNPNEVKNYIKGYRKRLDEERRKEYKRRVKARQEEGDRFITFSIPKGISEQELRQKAQEYGLTGSQLRTLINFRKSYNEKKDDPAENLDPETWRDLHGRVVDKDPKDNALSMDIRQAFVDRKIDSKQYEKLSDDIEKNQSDAFKRALKPITNLFSKLDDKNKLFYYKFDEHKGIDFFGLSPKKYKDILYKPGTELPPGWFVKKASVDDYNFLEGQLWQYTQKDPTPSQPEIDQFLSELLTGKNREYAEKDLLDRIIFKKKESAEQFEQEARESAPPDNATDVNYYNKGEVAYMTFTVDGVRYLKNMTTDKEFPITGIEKEKEQ